MAHKAGKSPPSVQIEPLLLPHWNPDEQRIQRSVGDPGRQHILSAGDLLSITSVLLCAVLAYIALLHTGTAANLGQINQLVVLGILFSIMASASNRQIRLFMLLREERFGKSRLQNFEAILENNSFAMHWQLTWPVRLILLLLVALPLAIGASYKKFTGGQTTVPADSDGGLYGYTGPPGTQRLGLGLSLMANATVTYISDPEYDRVYDRVYGFNLYTIDNTSTAFLDGPLPTYVASIQAKLRAGESRLITATVNGTISTYKTVPASLSSNKSFGSDASNLSIYPGYFSFLVPDATKSNYTQLYTSVWRQDGNPNETFASQAMRIYTERRLCNGTWSISPSTVNLHSAICIDTASPDQNLVNDVIIAAKADFLPMLAEFISQRGKRASGSLVATAVGAMLWARITTLVGHECVDGGAFTQCSDFNATWNMERGGWYFTSDFAMTTVATLHKSLVLELIIAIHPILVLLLTFGKGLLAKKSPATDGFGIVALLAGTENESKRVLKGAEVSGKLRQPVRVIFEGNDGSGYKSKRFRLTTD